MRNLAAKLMIILACAIIMLHAFVPHHHDDCCGAVECFFGSPHHEHHHHHDEHPHPFDTCHLQDLLSHLVLTSRQDDLAIADWHCLQSHDCFQLMLAALADDLPLMALHPHTVCWPHGVAGVSPAPFHGAKALRAPPAC